MKDIDPKLLEKINQALHQTLMTMVRSVVAIGATPQTVISMIRERLDMIETMVKEENRGTTADVGVRVDGGAGEATEAQVVATSSPADPEHVADFRRKRGVQPPNQAEYFGEWSDDDTARYGINPGIPPNQSL